ncbi:ATP-dependent Clp protease ATP-binding subunit ClpE [Bacillus oleivorans]|uniref:ATP-dependent Clp protease ATP-binding subunit ClpE n=1 Tax=Bacillus oleivorans TaxID=1448271 RepID=A0A285D2P5_9BACI|nr:ATP-dependent Clp protease ATP-binding subunit [Bacillus oleivorans]SNX73935.1 ATP-dependent Clp protease ATP-binding subunit ClpE [Bacillus oleivorans]
MLCQQCHKRQATIHLRYQLNNQINETHICQECYQDVVNYAGLNGNNTPYDHQFPFGSWNKSIQKENKQKDSFLENHAKNLSTLAKTGRVDPVIGRDDELEQVIEILNRRNKNNPVLIGEPGVGKTAIAEGLALKVAEGSVPEKLLNKTVYVLDVASLVANTGIRGQFEEKMKKLIEEVQSDPSIILFIDELHLLVGAGSAEGSMDAGNILKPALARGELQLIGATTLKEYRKIEKDAALERRFQPVTVKEPTLEAAAKILSGLKDRYEDFHQVTYTDEAIKACVELSHRYIQDRFLPDKAIDLLDQAGSKVQLDANKGSSSEIKKQLAILQEKKEQALKLEHYEEAAKLRDQENNLLKQLNEVSESSEKPVVSVDVIHQLIEKKTGIPVGKLENEENLKLKNLENAMKQKVIGQNQAIEKVARAVKRSRAGLKAKSRPIGSFLFVGPTGVGKTELAKTLAYELFGTKDALIRLDMSEYMEKHSISKIIGSPPGYVGHEDAGQLTEKIRRNPYSIILLDEIEKAHPDVQHLFLQILEDGRLTDSHGTTVSFKDTVIIMTSNAGVSEAKKAPVGFNQSDVEEETSILERLGGFFKPEFLNRFDSIIEFNSLEEPELIQIVELLLQELANTLQAEHQIELDVTEEAKKLIAKHGYHPQFGARPLRRVIQEKIEDPIADLLLESSSISKIVVEVTDSELSIQSI